MVSEDNQTEDSKFCRVSDDYSHLSQEENPIDWDISSDSEDSIVEETHSQKRSQEFMAQTPTKSQTNEDILRIDSENTGEEVVNNGMQFLKTVVASVTAVVSTAVYLLWC